MRHLKDWVATVVIALSVPLGTALIAYGDQGLHHAVVTAIVSMGFMFLVLAIALFFYILENGWKS